MPSTRPELLFVVWSPVTGPIMAYWNLGLANRHAETMVGVEVKTVDVRTSLPPLVLDDVVTRDYDVEDPTPVQDLPPVHIRVDELEDASDDAETRVVDVDEG